MHHFLAMTRPPELSVALLDGTCDSVIHLRNGSVHFTPTFDRSCVMLDRTDEQGRKSDKETASR